MDSTTERQLKTLALPASGVVQTQGFMVNRTRIMSFTCTWTGTPTGSISAVVSNDSTDGINGTWDPCPATVPAAISPQPAGGAGHTAFETTTGFRMVAIKYTATSGTGTLNVTGFGKG